MKLLYAYPELEDQFEKLPEALRVVLEEFAKWSESRGFPAPLVTCIVRTPSQNKAAGGAPNSLHLEGRAVDLRNTGSAKEPHYTAEQRMACEAWLKRRCPKWVFELVLTSHGTGPHWHIGLRRPKASKEGVA